MRNLKVDEAAAFLERECGVIPEEWSMYEDSYFFRAYSKDVPKNKRSFVTTPFYIVDLEYKKAGPFSRVFDPTGYDKCVEKLIKL